MFKPNTGRLWRFYQETLAAAVPLQGTAYVAVPGSVKVSPGFVTLLNKAKAFSEALYANDSPDPHLTMQVTPVASDQFPAVAIDLDGMQMRSSRNGNSESARVSWPGSAHEAKLSANIGPQEYTIAGPYSGQWALFQLFNQADEWTPQGSGYRVGWELRTSAQRAVSQTGASAKATIQIDVPANIMLVLKKGFFAGADCGGNIAQ
jgi:type VI protein secretion system component VasK